MKWDAKNVIIVIVLVIVGTTIAQFLVKEKHALNGKTYKSLLASPSLPSGQDPANPAAVASQSMSAANAAANMSGGN